MSSKPEPPADFWERLERELQSIPVDKAERPPNSFTTQEYMQQLKLGKSATQGRIGKLLQAGKIQAVKGVVRRSDGQFTQMVWYVFND